MTFECERSLAIDRAWLTILVIYGRFGNSKVIFSIASSMLTCGIYEIVEKISMNSGILDIIRKKEELAANIGMSFDIYSATTFFTNLINLLSHLGSLL